MSKPTVGFAIPSIPPREEMLRKAVESIAHQSYPVSQLSVEFDLEHTGAGPTRERAIKAMHTDWTCLLDDDDWVYPEHVEALLRCADDTGADIVYPWFDVIGGADPFPQFFGLPWEPDSPRIFPITVLARTELLQQSTFPEPDVGSWMGDDWPFWEHIQNELGGKIVHLPQRTWAWVHHAFPGNTSGVPSRW